MAFYTKDSARYPYTFAADWVREAGLAESRSEASRLISRIADEWGIRHEDMAKMIADKALMLGAAIEDAETQKRAALISFVRDVEGLLSHTTETRDSETENSE